MKPKRSFFFLSIALGVGFFVGMGCQSPSSVAQDCSEEVSQAQLHGSEQLDSLTTVYESLLDNLARLEQEGKAEEDSLNAIISRKQNPPVPKPEGHPTRVNN